MSETKCGTPYTCNPKCDRCGDTPSAGSGSWRWNSRAWEHRCYNDHPQAGHSEIRCSGCTPPKCETCDDERLIAVRQDGVGEYAEPCPTCTPPTGDGLKERAREWSNNQWNDEIPSHHSLAAFARQIRDEAVRERDEKLRELRQKLAIAGVEGSPPPGMDTTIGRLRATIAELRKERDDYYAQVHGLRGSVAYLTEAMRNAEKNCDELVRWKINRQSQDQGINAQLCAYSRRADEAEAKLSRSVPIETVEGWLSTCASKHMGGMETRQEIRFKIKEYQRCSSSGGSDGGVSTVNRHSGGGSHGSPSSEPSPLPGATSNPELSSAPAAAPASDPAATGLRPSVAAFAWRMEATLRRHDAKKGGQKNWRKDDVLDLRDRLLDETEELRLATHLPDYDDRRRRVAAEAIDVANFAMMIADKCDPLPDDSDPAATGGEEGPYRVKYDDMEPKFRWWVNFNGHIRRWESAIEAEGFCRDANAAFAAGRATQPTAPRTPGPGWDEEKVLLAKLAEHCERSHPINSHLGGKLYEPLAGYEEFKSAVALRDRILAAAEQGTPGGGQVSKESA